MRRKRDESFIHPDPNYEADLDRGGASVLDIWPLLWKDGWPVAGDNLKEGTYQFESVRTGTVIELAVEGFPVGGKRLTLNKGPNIVRAAMVNGGGATDFCARFLDEDDKPLKEITVSLSAVRVIRAHEKTRGRGSHAGGVVSRIGQHHRSPERLK